MKILNCLHVSLEILTVALVRLHLELIQMSARGHRATEEAPLFDEILFLSGCVVNFVKPLTLIFYF